MRREKEKKGIGMGGKGGERGEGESEVKKEEDKVRYSRFNFISIIIHNQKDKYHIFCHICETQYIERVWKLGEKKEKEVLARNKNKNKCPKI